MSTALTLGSRMTDCRRGRVLVTAALFVAAAGGPTGGRAQTWDGGGTNNNWSTANNWSPNGVPPSGANIIFAGTTRLTPVLDSNRTVNALTFSNTAGAFSISGANTLTLGGSGITNNDTQTQLLNVDNVVLSASQTWDAAAGNLTISPATLNLGVRTLTVTGGFNTTISTDPLGVTGGHLVKNGTGTLFWNAG
ncbi:MAG: hypothetical protein AB7Q17_06825, partial [Phycisphaerae bacterium]